MMEDETKLQKELEALMLEHTDLEKMVKLALASHECDTFEIARIKKRKLIVKDRIAELYMKLYPDIVA